ncbi:MAG: FAA hydrolase family protein [Candidatus Thorarchaeota archaeon]|nr:FAA hydrolase family protein [Candidatus Thorarchaeota archaeon]
MRLVTYSQKKATSIALEIEGELLDIPKAASELGMKDMLPSQMIDLLRWEHGLSVVAEILDRYEGRNPDERPRMYSMDSLSILAPIARPGKIIGLGLNYKDHIEETGRDIPGFPEIFAKFSSSVTSPNQGIPIPKVTKKLDWEIELGVVIGKICKEVVEDDVLDYIAGYTIINDLSARDLQREGTQWVHGKSLDGLCPMGPCIVTVDELDDASGLTMQTRVNGVLKQDSSTSSLRYGVRQVVSFLSKSFTLEPGDVIATGTPSGVGFARTPPEFLKPGDTVELFIEGIGYLRNKIVA